MERIGHARLYVLSAQNARLPLLSIQLIPPLPYICRVCFCEPYSAGLETQSIEDQLWGVFAQFLLYVNDIAYCCIWQLFSHFNISFDIHCIYFKLYSRLGTYPVGRVYPIYIIVIVTITVVYRRCAEELWGLVGSRSRLSCLLIIGQGPDKRIRHVQILSFQA